MAKTGGGTAVVLLDDYAVTCTGNSGTVEVTPEEGSICFLNGSGENLEVRDAEGAKILDLPEGQCKVWPATGGDLFHAVNANGCEKLVTVLP